MMLPFTKDLFPTSQTDPEIIAFARSHYSRRNPRSKKLFGPARTLTLRNAEATIVFGWIWTKEGMRRDKQEGFCCAIFRNESKRSSSEVILEAEKIAIAAWGPNRMFTYVNPAKIKSRNPGYCFKLAGWKFVGRSANGLHLLVKQEKTKQE